MPIVESMTVYVRGAVPIEAPVEIIAPGIGRITCPECNGDPEGYAAQFREGELTEPICIDCKGAGVRYVAA
jgi:hypothetical protein